MKARKERTHASGISNRTQEIKAPNGPINFDATMRATAARKMEYQTDSHVPVAVTGTGNNDFAPAFPGHDFRQPSADPVGTRRLKKEARAATAAAAAAAGSASDPEVTATPTGAKGAAVPVVGAVLKDGTQTSGAARETRQRGHKVAPRWNPARWYEDPAHERAPLQKDGKEAWNHAASQKLEGRGKSQDRLMRAVRGADDSESEVMKIPHHELSDSEEYYPGRSTIDAAVEEPGDDFQVRPLHLPDFALAPPEKGDNVARVRRLQQAMRQRYAGKPKLFNVFRNCSLQKSGFVFPADLTTVFDQMGMRVAEDECQLLIQAVDKDGKGAITFEEFSDLIYGPRVSVGGSKYEAQERHVRHVTKSLVDTVMKNGSKLSRAFCEVDPEKQYSVNKRQFQWALESACRHISPQAVEFLWSAQFANSEEEGTSVDWRNFMGNLAYFSHDNRVPTPCFMQGRKHQYDLLQRTAALSGGSVPELDLIGQDQDAEDDNDVHIVAGKFCNRQNKLLHKPRDAAMLTEPYVETLRVKASRAERALPERIPQARLRQLLGKRTMVHQDELVALIMEELDNPGATKSLAAQRPVYESGHQEVRDAGSPEEQSPASPQALRGSAHAARVGGSCLKVVQGEVEAFVATHRTNKEHEVDVESFISQIYRPPDEKMAIETVNDGLNRHLRGHRPPRERPPRGEAEGGGVRLEDEPEALALMEEMAEAISQVETSNGGRVKASKVFKRLDVDGDGYVSLSDLRRACEKYRLAPSDAQVHALLSRLDPKDNGSVNIGEFMANFEVQGGSLLNDMARSIKGVRHAGGPDYDGPQSDPEPSSGSRACSAPPTGGGGSEHSGSGGLRSQMGRTGASITGTPSVQEVPQFGRSRISDAIRGRCSSWKPLKSERYTSLPKTRFGMTVYPDTRHITEASVPLSGSFLGDRDRFRTTNVAMGAFAAPDLLNPQTADAARKHARSEFRIDRIQQRQADFADRRFAAAEAVRTFDEAKVARKAMSQLCYERKCHMSFA